MTRDYDASLEVRGLDATIVLWQEHERGLDKECARQLFNIEGADNRGGNVPQFALDEHLTTEAQWGQCFEELQELLAMPEDPTCGWCGGGTRRGRVFRL